MSDRYEHVVIGGGISGLALAHWAQRRGVQTLVLEAEERVGGCMNSQVFPGCDDFWVEAGSHTCYNSYGHLLDILADVGLLELLIPKAKVSYALWRGGGRKPILSGLHPLELLLSLPRLLRVKKTGRSVRDFYTAILGAANYRDLFGPAFNAVICQEADDFPAELLFRRKPRRKEVMRSFTLPQGLSAIPLTLASQTGLEVRTGQRVVRILSVGDDFRVLLEGEQEIICHSLSLATPPDVVASLLGSLAGKVLSNTGLDAIASIGMQEIETLVLCVPASVLGHLPPIAGLIAVDDTFNAMVSRDYLGHEIYRGFSFHFRPGLLAAEAQRERACAVLGIGPDAIAGLARVHNRLPALRVGQGERMARIDAALAGTRLAITGNWFQGVSVEDCLTRSFQECQRLFA